MLCNIVPGNNRDSLMSSTLANNEKYMQLPPILENIRMKPFLDRGLVARATSYLFKAPRLAVGYSMIWALLSCARRGSAAVLCARR